MSIKSGQFQKKNSGQKSQKSTYWGKTEIKILAENHVIQERCLLT